MASNINDTGVNKNYPIAGQDNDSQGFRDNFSNIKTAIDSAKSAISTIEGTAPSKQADNDFNDNTISKVILQDSGLAAPSAETLAGETNVDFTAGHYRRLICTTEKPSTNTIVVQNWGPANALSHMTLEVRSNNTSQKFLNFSTPSGNILTDSTNLNLSSDFDMTDGNNTTKHIFELWSPDQGANIFIYYKGKFE